MPAGRGGSGSLVGAVARVGAQLVDGAKQAGEAVGEATFRLRQDAFDLAHARLIEFGGADEAGPAGVIGSPVLGALRVQRR